MSMGEAKHKVFVDTDGNKRINRIPQKPLNQFIKATLLTLLERDDILIKENVRAGSNTLTVFDSNGKYLFSYENGWDYGYYRILMANPNEGAQPFVVAEMDWFDNDAHTNQQQRDIFDIFDAVRKKEDALNLIEKARKNLTPEEVQALQALGLEK